MEIRRKLQVTEHRDGGLHPVMAEIRELAANLKIVEIQRLLAPYIEK